MAISLTSTGLDARSLANGAGPGMGTGSLKAANFSTDYVSMSDDTSMKIGNGGNNYTMLFNIYSYSGVNRPGQSVIGHFGTEATSHCSITVNGNTSSWSGNVQAVAGSYQASAPSGTTTSDGYFSIWAGYPQGVWVINRLGVSCYLHYMIPCTG